MAEISDELKAKLLRAQSAGEAAELLKADGQDETQAERLWDELTRRREADGRALSPDELEAVSGGEKRDWATEGCAATVRPNSWCGSNDACIRFSVIYDNEPESTECPVCGTYLYIYSTYPKALVTTYKCRNCGYTKITE